MLAPNAVRIRHKQVRKAICKGSPIDGLECDGVREGSDATGELFGFVAVEEADALLRGGAILLGDGEAGYRGGQRQRRDVL